MHTWTWGEKLTNGLNWLKLCENCLRQHPFTILYTITNYSKSVSIFYFLSFVICILSLIPFINHCNGVVHFARKWIVTRSVIVMRYCRKSVCTSVIHLKNAISIVCVGFPAAKYECEWKINKIYDLIWLGDKHMTRRNRASFVYKKPLFQRRRSHRCHHCHRRSM